MNNFLKQIHNQLFGRKGYHNEPFLHHEIQRDESYMDCYHDWEKDKKYIPWLDFMTKVMDERDSNFVDILQTETSNGLLFYINDFVLNKKDAHYIFDLLRDRVKQEGYVCHLSDTRIYNRSEFVEEKNRYFLKPRFEYCVESLQFIQRYGNIIIELIYENNLPKRIKICNHSYRDRKYSHVESFDELKEKLFNVA
ncbi:MAG: hypothetical protein HKN92_10040 [Chitinophagales bacterium]|nr:hypothetical protein [Chitinophagales bacterium]